MIAFNNAAEGGASPGTATTITISFATSGNNRLLVAAALQAGADNSNATTGITYNGVAMTKMDDTGWGGGANPNWISFWYLVNPASGTHDVVFTRSTTSNGYYGAVASYTGVLQTSPLGNHGAASGGSGATFAQAVTTTVDNSWAIWLAANQNNIPTAGSGTTARGNGTYTMRILDSEQR